MSTRTPVVADGSAAADAGPVIEIDRSTMDKWRYRCLNGHTTWSPTNSHIWCKQCRRQAEAGADVDPEHYEVLDEKTGETIAYSRVELVGE